MHARWLSFVIWALVAASLAYWGLALAVKGPQAPAQTRPALSSSMPADWTRLFAAAQPAAVAPVEAESARFQLLGLVAPSAGSRHPGEGVALIAVAGAPPKPVRIGQAVDGDLKLIEINRRDAGLGRGDAVTVRLTLAAGAASGGDPAGMSPQMSPQTPGQVLPSPNVAPPTFGPGGPGRNMAPAADAMIVPTAINPQLPPMPQMSMSPAADGSAHPLK